MQHHTTSSAVAAELSACTLQQSADYECRLTLRPLATPAKHAELAITSIWAGARQPRAEQVRFRAVLDEQGLRGLHASLEAHLRKWGSTVTG
ncbi:MAG: hypothetical protein ACKOB5_10145 [Betaproteobacteria bacterium]